MIVFTICSNNYLAQAKTLGDSVAKCDPGCIFIIGLVDELQKGIDYNFFKPYTIVPVAKIGLAGFDDLWKKYDIIEFNTCVKASFFKYIFKKYPDERSVFYLDPDIAVYQPLELLEKEFTGNDVLLTPHILTPIPLDGKMPGENVFLNYGLYNLGFIGLHRNAAATGGLLDWWEERTLSIGFNNPAKGLFVDQLWINLVPIYYKKVKVLDHPGLNMAPWNLHERQLTGHTDKGWIVNKTFMLVFYHFSSYKFDQPEKLSKHYARYSFEGRHILHELYELYRAELVKNKIDKFESVQCRYVEKREAFLASQSRTTGGRDKRMHRTKNLIKQFIPPVIMRLKK